MNIQRPGTDTIYYRGHGLIETASPYASTGHVMLHEFRHIREFKDIAQAKGMEAVNPHVKIDFEFRDGKLVAVAGKASASFVPRKEKQNASESAPGAECQATDRGGCSSTRGSQAGESGKGPSVSADDAKIEQTLQKLKSVKDKIERHIESLKTKADREEPDGSVPGQDVGPDGLGTSQKLDSLEDRARKVSFVISRLEARQSAALTEDLLNKVVDVGNALGLVQARYGLSNGKASGNSPDKITPQTQSSVNAMADTFGMAGITLDLIV